MKTKPLSAASLGFLALLVATSAIGQSAYFQAVTNLNPVGYWPMHEIEAPAQGDIETNYGSLGLLGTAYYPDWANANGNVIQHQAAGALSGDADTSVHFAQTKISGTAVSFTNGLFIPHTSPLTTLNPPFSVECWFFPTNNSTGVTIWGQCGLEGLNAGAEGGTTGLINGIVMNWANSTFVVYGLSNQLNTSIQNSNKVVVENTVMPSNQWYHLVVTCDIHTNFVLYTNGLQAATGNGAGKYSPDYWTPLSIGCGLGNTRSIAGSIDEFAVYTNALQASDVQQHYNAALDPTDFGAYFTNVLADNPIIYLRMDAPAYTAPPTATWPPLTNFGSVAVNGTYAPGATPGIVPGPADTNGVPYIGLAAASGTNVAQLSGVSSVGDAGFDPTYNPTGLTPFSVSAIFRGNPCDNRTQTIVGHSGNSWAINMTTTGKLQCQLGTNTTSAVTSSGVYNDGKWHQVVEVYTPASDPSVTGTNALFVDGVLDNSVSTVTTNGILPGTNVDVVIAGDPQFLNNPAGVGRQFAGEVCEVALFTQALTAFQVRQLYGIVGAPPIITQQPLSGSVNLGGAFTNTVVATGSIQAYQWYKNNSPLAGQTSASLTLNPVVATDASVNYYVVLTNPYTSVTSAVVSLTVNSAPVITSQTSTNIVFAGSSPNFYVNAVGTPVLAYQWTSNGVPITGATGSSFTVINAHTSATYGGMVTNAFGTNLFTPMPLVVLPVPTNPYPAIVVSDHPVSYWRLNESSGVVGHDYIGGNNGIYTNALLGQAGYTSLFSPQTDVGETGVFFGNLATNNSHLGSIPTNVTFASPSNSSAEFSVEAWIQLYGAEPAGAGLVTLGYGAGGEQFCLDLATTANFLRFLVRDAGGTVHSAQSTNVPQYGSWHHVVGVCDQANASLYLYMDGQLIASNSVPAGSGLLASSQSLSIGARQEGLGTQFDDQFLGTMDDVALYNYSLSPNQVLGHYYAAGIAPANVQIQPPSLNINQNENEVFTSAVTGTPPLYYYWTDLGNGNNLLSTNSSLTITNAQTTDSYQLVVSNLYGTSGTTITLGVYSGPVFIVNDLASTLFDVPPGFPVSLAVTVGGTAPFHYQWYLNSSTPIPGATDATYTFPATVGTNTYTLWATNQSGGTQTASSLTATVEVGATPVAFGFNSGGGWTANGKATFTGSGALQLTDGNINETASAFFGTPEYVDGFIATYTYTPATGSTPIRADGVTFCLQNAPRGTAALGTDAGGLGYNGITPSVAFEMDIFVNRAGGPGINWETNGLTSGTGGLHNGGAGPININTGDPIDVTLFYNYAAGRLTAGLFDENTTASFVTNYHVGDLGQLLGTNYAYVGFTGGSGADGAIQTISNFSFSYSQAPPLFISPAAGGNFVISWPGALVTSSFALQQSSSVLGPWSNVGTIPTTPTVDNDLYQVTVPASGSSQFFRLTLLNQ